jgi:hypothetical protein
MEFSERITVIERLPYESRIAFVAFCAERCLKEAGLHPVAREQLESLPLLVEGLEMLWARAERGTVPSPGAIERILAHLSSYDSTAPDLENVVYHYDVVLVDAANVVRSGLRKVQDPETATPDFVVSALEGPYHSVSVIYADYKRARKGELTVIDTALLRLLDWGNKPFSRVVFEGIPEWPRGELSKKYAANRVKGTAEDDDE